MPAKRTEQSDITSMAFPLLQKSIDICPDRQINPGEYWIGRMSDEESILLYECSVREYHALHKWDAGGGPPSQAIELLEMCVDGQGSRETAGSNDDRTFFTKHCLS